MMYDSPFSEERRQRRQDLMHKRLLVILVGALLGMLIATVLVRTPLDFHTPYPLCQPV